MIEAVTVRSIVPHSIIQSHHNRIMNQVNTLAYSPEQVFSQKIQLCKLNLLASNTSFVNGILTLSDLTLNKTTNLVAKGIVLPITFIASADFSKILDQMAGPREWIQTAKKLGVLIAGSFLSLLAGLSSFITPKLAQLNAELQAKGGGYEKNSSPSTVAVTPEDKEKKAAAAKVKAAIKLFENLKNQAETARSEAIKFGQKTKSSKDSLVSLEDQIKKAATLSDLDNTMQIALQIEKETPQEAASAQRQADLFAAILDQAKDLSQANRDVLEKLRSEAATAASQAKDDAAGVQKLIGSIKTVEAGTRADLQIEETFQVLSRDILILKDRAEDNKKLAKFYSNQAQEDSCIEEKELKDLVDKANSLLALTAKIEDQRASIMNTPILPAQDLARRAATDPSLQPLLDKVSKLAATTNSCSNTILDLMGEAEEAAEDTKEICQVKTGPSFATLAREINLLFPIFDKTVKEFTELKENIENAIQHNFSSASSSSPKALYKEFDTLKGYLAPFQETHDKIFTRYQQISDIAKWLPKTLDPSSWEEIRKKVVGRLDKYTSFQMKNNVRVVEQQLKKFTDSYNTDIYHNATPILTKATSCHYSVKAISNLPNKIFSQPFDFRNFTTHIEEIITDFKTIETSLEEIKKLTDNLNTLRRDKGDTDEVKNKVEETQKVLKAIKITGREQIPKIDLHLEKLKDFSKQYGDQQVINQKIVAFTIAKDNLQKIFDELSD